MHVFVLAGGEGTRLRPYTYSIPKPMMVLGGKPLLQYVLENLRRCGFSDVTLTVGYKHETIVDYFGDGSKFGMKIAYSIEKEKLNTAGSIYAFRKGVKGTFAVVMGDHLTDIDMKDMLKKHREGGNIATIALYHAKSPLEYGIATIKGGKVTGFSEKPVLEHYYNTAIYIFEPEIFEFIGEKEDFGRDVFPKLLKAGKPINAYVFDGVWFDIGRVSDYERFVESFNLMRMLEKLKS